LNTANGLAPVRRFVSITMNLCLRARLVLPIQGAPIENGAVGVAGERITWCGTWESRPAEVDRAQVFDFGDSILLPGLVNAHCHLDYTAMAEKLPRPRTFADWIKGLVALKSAWTVPEFAESWRQGAAMLLRTGTTTVADIEAMPELLPNARQTTPLRVISFRELIHLKPGDGAAQLVDQAVRHLEELPEFAQRVALSPHAPYSTTASLLEASAEAARRRGWRLMTHVAESEEEFEMFMYRQGAMFEWLKHQRDMSDCGLGSPVQHLERYGYLDKNLIAVHVNHLWRHDAGILGRNGVSVVHCPRSHDYFQHFRFPRDELEAAGVNVCLGTDSLASVRRDGGEPLQLDLFAEMRALQSASPSLGSEPIVRMATVNAARALGRTDLGRLGAGAMADVIVLAAAPSTTGSQDCYDAVVHHRGAVAASLIGGQWAMAGNPTNVGT
jgi:cytosine/adenosine deaminase-related metal-dependent hydrolase